MDAHGEPDQRVGRPPDAAALAAVISEGFATYREWAPEGWSPPDWDDAQLLRERLALPGYWCWMAEARGQAVGYVVLRPAMTAGDDSEPIPGLGHIWHLFVSPAWWGTGLAKTLQDAAIEEARRRDCDTMRLWTPRDNARARGFYEREGWRHTGAERYAEDIDLALFEYRRPVILAL